MPNYKSHPQNLGYKINLPVHTAAFLGEHRGGTGLA